MMSADAVPGTVTRLLIEWGQGKEEALPTLMPLVYDELRGLARRYLRREPAANTLQSAALVHEAYFRLVEQKQMSWKNRAQFIGVAAQLMRRILVSRARRQRALKRGAGVSKLSLTDAIDLPKTREVDLVRLDDALQRIEELDPQQARIVELRFFGGLSIEEAAEVLGISSGTVKRGWAMARTWLHRQVTA
jgi:RNA polymerase sigma factor (TIGR02999 family)